ncbi:putative membrane protein [Pedobacter sp. UYP24]
MEAITTNAFQKTIRIVLGLFMIFAGLGHLTLNRTEFQAQVPNWIPLSKDFVVVSSGIIEIILGIAMLFFKKQRIGVGLSLAIFYLLIFPGNISQYLNDTDAFGLNTEKARLVRLLFQPILIFCALWSTGAIDYLRKQ